jgi:hypothetical protein
VITGVQKGYSQVIEEGLTGDEWVITKGIIKGVPGKQVVPERVQAQSADVKTVQEVGK